MSSADEIREFLTSRRAKLSPERAGVPMYGRKRRVPGLRREEVALRAGISVEWYTRLERGVARGVSDEVLDAIGTALQLDEAERSHLADLVRTANAERPPRRNPTPQRVRASVARLVDVMGAIPACVTNGRLDVLYANDLAEALFSDSSGIPSGRQTWPASCSSTRERGPSTPTGRKRPATRPPYFAPKPAGIRTTGACPT
jgi:transcriptional regulator with XRE-family HTH domain